MNDLVSYKMSYRETQQVSDLGWVDFDLDVQLILLSCSSHSAYLSPAKARSGKQWNSQNQSQYRPGPRPAAPPCRLDHSYKPENKITWENGTVSTWECDLSMSLTQSNVEVQAGKVHALVHETVQNRQVERPPQVCQVVAHLQNEITFNIK